MKTSTELEKESVMIAAGHMAAAARTAPKTRGIDNIEVFVIDDEKTKRSLIYRMTEIAKEDKKPSFERDAISIFDSIALLAIGVKSNPAGLNCGFCGYLSCDALKMTKGVCGLNSVDLGIAVSSAVSIANQFHIDNRIMYSIGKAAISLKLFAPDVNQALVIPLSVTGKNPYFDRK